MSVQRVEQQEPGLKDGIKSAAIGGLTGYAAKYALPLTSQETDADYKHIVDLIKKNADKARQEFLAEISNLPQKSPAQDAYISSSKNFARNSVYTYNNALKKIRPTAPFVIAGAVTGLLVSFVRNVFSTDVN